MPEDNLPEGVESGSLQHLLFITLTATIDYMRDADALWESSRKTYADPETSYLFDVSTLADTPFEQLMTDMKKYSLSKMHKNDVLYWRTVGASFHKKWEGEPEELPSGLRLGCSDSPEKTKA